MMMLLLLFDNENKAPEQHGPREDTSFAQTLLICVWYSRWPVGQARFSELFVAAAAVAINLLIT